MEENKDSAMTLPRNYFGASLRVIPTVQEKGRVFVTVGSSPEDRFDDLVQAVTTPECLRVLKKRGYTSLVIQRGNGRFLPAKSKANDYFQIEHFGSKPNINQLINDHIHAASLVISNAGAGSIFKTLRAQRSLVVVLNSQFSGEYELEMAKQFSKFMYCCSPETLVNTLNIMDLKSLVPYPPHPPPFPVVADLNNSLRHYLQENKALAPFQETLNSAVPTTPESPITDLQPSSSEPTSALEKMPTNLKSQDGKGKKRGKNDCSTTIVKNAKSLISDCIYGAHRKEIRSSKNLGLHVDLVFSRNLAFESSLGNIRRSAVISAQLLESVLACSMLQTFRFSRFCHGFLRNQHESNESGVALRSLWIIHIPSGGMLLVSGAVGDLVLWLDTPSSSPQLSSCLGNHHLVWGLIVCEGPRGDGNSMSY